MMQCKDIPTIPILIHVKKHGGIGCSWFSGDERDVVNAMPRGTPEKLRFTKMKNLIHKGLIDGCPCGCRGDYELSTKGEKLIDSISPF